jgi:hypothetical protein
MRPPPRPLKQQLCRVSVPPFLRFACHSLRPEAGAEMLGKPGIGGGRDGAQRLSGLSVLAPMRDNRFAPGTAARHDGALGGPRRLSDVY